MGELEAVVSAIQPTFLALHNIKAQSQPALATEAVSMGKEHIERTAQALSKREDETTRLRADLVMGEVPDWAMHSLVVILDAYL